MMGQILFSKKNISNLSSAESARSMVSVKEPSKIGSKQHFKNFHFYFIFQRKQVLTFHAK